MNLTSLIQLLQNKVSVLQTARGQAYSIGDMNQLNAIDAELLETQNTIAQLGTLANIAQAASSVNASLTQVAASGIDALQNPDPVVQGPSASAIFNGYDISAYATDPQYATKIQTILTSLPTFSVVGDIDAYIQSTAQGSPVTGSMVFSSAQQYGVDIPLMMAIMENDSDFGTLGIGASTFNPGNIGNTGTSTQTYPSWADGVSAVANWLNNHRVVTPTTPITPTPDTTTDATTTPAVIIPTTQVVAATSTAAFIIPTLNATTTPIFTPTNVATSTTATSTDTTSTSTSPIATSTTPTTSAATSTTATSTDSTVGTGDDNATTTPDNASNATSTATTTGDTATSTPPSNATTTPDAAASTTTSNATTTASGTTGADVTSTSDASGSADASTTTPTITAPPTDTAAPTLSAASSTQAIRKLRVKSA
jgi:hypothetical protein